MLNSVKLSIEVHSNSLSIWPSLANAVAIVLLHRDNVTCNVHWADTSSYITKISYGTAYTEIISFTLHTPIAAADAAAVVATAAAAAEVFTPAVCSLIIPIFDDRVLFVQPRVYTVCRNTVAPILSDLLGHRRECT